MGRNVTAIVAVNCLIVLVAFTLSSYTLWSQRNLDRAARIRQCEVSNRARYGGPDYLRDLIRVGFVRTGQIDLARLVEDVPQIDCMTGEPIPIPTP